jgi:hypothetical protein
MIGDRMLKALNKQIESNFFGRPDASVYGSGVAAADARLFGLRVIGTPHLTNTAVLIKGCDV